jgi:hypothetical protein
VTQKPLKTSIDGVNLIPEGDTEATKDLDISLLGYDPIPSEKETSTDVFDSQLFLEYAWLQGSVGLKEVTSDSTNELDTRDVKPKVDKETSTDENPALCKTSSVLNINPDQLYLQYAWIQGGLCILVNQKLEIGAVGILSNSSSTAEEECGTLYDLFNSQYYIENAWLQGTIGILASKLGQKQIYHDSPIEHDNDLIDDLEAWLQENY